MTPSFIGRMAWMLPGVRPIISRASWPTATIRLLSLTATTEGVRMTMPSPNLGPRERSRAHDGRMWGVLERDVGTHAPELAEELEAVLEDRLVDPARPGRLGEQDARRWLEVRREAGIRRGRHVHGAIAAVPEGVAAYLDRVAAALDAHPCPAEDVEERLEVVARRAAQRDVAAGDRGRHDERAGLDPV